VSVHPSAPLTSYKIVSDIRVEITRLLDIDTAQRILAERLTSRTVKSERKT
jgi:hypothetical protein